MTEATTTTDHNSPSPPPTPSAVTPPAPAAADAPPASPSAAPASGVEPALAAPKARERDWRDDKIDQLYAKLKDVQRRTAPTVDPNAMVPKDQVDARAVEIAANLRFNEECQKVFDEGSKQFEDFGDKVNELRRVTTPGDPQSEAAYNTMIAAAIRSGDAARVIHQLGSDLKQAQRLMSMDPMSMTAELTRMAMGNGPRNDITRAPKPITPVSTRSSGVEDINPGDPVAADRLTTAEWMARRNKVVASQSTGRSARFR